ncbi:MAG: PfkB family carbohydrate kinase, partial [Candidatus Odinarchaeota archaeon]
MNIDLIIRGSKFFSLNDIKPWIGTTKVHYLVAGSIGYIALNLKMFGNEVHVISSISNDYFGKYILSEFKKNNIDTDYIEIEKDKLSGIGIYLPLVEN